MLNRTEDDFKSDIVKRKEAVVIFNRGVWATLMAFSRLLSDGKTGEEALNELLDEYTKENRL